MPRFSPPFDVTIGKCAVISDPFGTRLCILDLTKGLRPLNLAGSTSAHKLEEPCPLSIQHEGPVDEAGQTRPSHTFDV